MQTQLIFLSYSLVLVSGFGGTNLFGIETIIPKYSSTSLNMIRRNGRPKGPVRTIEVKPTMNAQINYETLRVTAPNPKGKDDILGIMSKAEALEKAKNMGGLDLILINEHSDPPVCKIVDYSKYRYMKEKKAKEVKKNAKGSEVKEVKMSYKIDIHDYSVRMKNASKFLSQGNRVKCTVAFRGREVQHDKLGFDLIDKLVDDLGDLCTMEGKPKRDGRNLSCFIAPKPTVLKAISEKKRSEEKALRKKRDASKRVMEEKLEAKQTAISIAQLEEEKKEGDKEDFLLNILEGVEKDDDVSIDDLIGGDGITDDLFG